MSEVNIKDEGYSNYGYSNLKIDGLMENHEYKKEFVMDVLKSSNVLVMENVELRSKVYDLGNQLELSLNTNKSKMAYTRMIWLAAGLLPLLFFIFATEISFTGNSFDWGETGSSDGNNSSFKYISSESHEKDCLFSGSRTNEYRCSAYA